MFGQEDRNLGGWKNELKMIGWWLLDDNEIIADQ